MSARGSNFLFLGLILAVVAGVGCTTSGGGGAGGGAPADNPATDNPAEEGGDDNPVPDGTVGEVEAIDCSGQPVRETGVNLTPFYSEFPRVSLPGGLIGEDRPRSVDLSASMPSPCHQGQLRSCVPWAVGYGMMTFYAHRDLGWDDPDAIDEQFSPTFLFNQANAFLNGRSRANDCTRAGAFVSDVLGFIQENGVAPMSLMPYVNDGNCLRVPVKQALDEAALYRISNYWRIEHDVETAKTYLLQETPIVIVALVAQPFMDLIGNRVYDRHDPDAGSAHCMLVIGYDDDRQAMMLLNSWGTFWGDEGYGWVAYDIWEDFVSEAWVANPDFSGVSSDLVSGPTVTDPYLDSDGDGIRDAVELLFADRGYDLETADNDGPPNLDSRTDTDMDGWPDEIEQRFGTRVDSADEYPFMPGYEYPAGFFDQFDANQGVLETDSDLAGEIPAAGDGDQAPPSDDEPDDLPPGVDPTLDSDNDGVPDWRDLCPDTLVGSIVDEDGCSF